jgi:anti-sigma B factor antagonist
MDKKSIVEIKGDDKAAVVAFKAALISDVAQVREAVALIRDFVEAKHPRRIAVDFGQVKFFSSRVLGMLLEVRADMEPWDGEVVICGINPQLYRVFKITNLDKIFKFYPDTATALESANEN